MADEMRPMFKVELGDKVRISRAATQRLEATVQRAIMAEIAKFDLKGDLLVKFSPEWYGIWLDGLDGPIVFDEPRLGM